MRLNDYDVAVMRMMIVDKRFASPNLCIGVHMISDNPMY